MKMSCLTKLIFCINVFPKNVLMVMISVFQVLRFVSCFDFEILCPSRLDCCGTRVMCRLHVCLPDRVNDEQ